MTDLTIVAYPVTVSRVTAAAMMGMSIDSFERYVQPHVCLIRQGSLRLVPVAELERWADENAERTIEAASETSSESPGAGRLVDGTRGRQ